MDRLNELIQHYVNARHADRVVVIAAWSPAPNVSAIVYTRPNTTQLYGVRACFGPHAADGTVEGYAADVALNMDEPLGAASRTLRRDEYGIAWVGIPPNQPIPTPPADVVATLPPASGSPGV